jgi:SAM-dependent methyltransferase
VAPAPSVPPDSDCHKVLLPGVGTSLPDETKRYEVTPEGKRSAKTRPQAMRREPGPTWSARALRVLPLLLIEALLALRAVPFIGRRFRCPCCGWKLRAFSAGGASLKPRDAGYCPRCGSKARHRRIWLFLEERTNLFSEPLDLLEISPSYCFSRRFVRMPNLRFVGAGLVGGPHISVRMDLAAAPIGSGTFDGIICVHVLEEIPDDRAAMKELFRMLKPGGWALVSVPTRLDQATYEDATITTRGARRIAFGEEAHVRVYGHDLIERLEACGFQVEVDLARDIDRRIRARHGLRDDENIFYCKRPLRSAPGKASRCRADAPGAGIGAT